MNHRLFTDLSILSLGASILMGCATNRANSDHDNIPFEEIAVLGQPPLLDSGNIVVRDRSTWESLWSAPQPIGQQAPVIDFNQKMVLGVNLGHHSDLEVPKLSVRWIRKRSDPDRIEIAYLVTKPTPKWGFSGQGIRVQYKFVSTPYSDLPVEFVRLPSNSAALHNKPMNTGGLAADYPKR
jgi:hypothetical protein